MKKFKKMIAVLMSVAMIVCMFSVPTSAASIFSGATDLKALDAISIENNTNNEKSFYYKINLSDKGKIVFHKDLRTTTCWGTERFYLYNSNGDTVINEYLSYIFEKNYTIDKKGVYYIKINLEGLWSDKKASLKNFYYSFQPENTPTISIAITMKVGDKIDFSTVASNYKGNVTWKTTKSSVATVSKGTVTAKKKGKAQIRAYMDNGDYAEITVKVTK